MASLPWDASQQDQTLQWAQQQQLQQGLIQPHELSEVSSIGFQAPIGLTPEEEQAMLINMAVQTSSVHSPAGSLYSDYSDHALDNQYHPGVQTTWDAVSSVSGDSSFYPSPTASPNNYLYSPALSAEIDFTTLNLNTEVPSIPNNAELGDMLDTPVFPDPPFQLSQASEAPNTNGHQPQQQQQQQQQQHHHHHSHLRTPSISIEVVEPSPIQASVNNMKLLDDLMDQSQGVEGIQASFDQGYQEFLRQYNLQDKVSMSKEQSPPNLLLNPSTSASRRRRLSEPPYISPNDVNSLTLSVPPRRRSKSVSKHKDEANPIYKCEHPGCGKTFTRPYNLSSHSRTHTSERPFLCPHPTCDKAFARQHDRNRHAKLHSGIKPHVCPNCGKAFARTDALNRHLKVENGCAAAIEQRQQLQPTPPQQLPDDQYFSIPPQLSMPPQPQHLETPPQFFFDSM